jgi:NADP-reducing hydrogenase subunit HndB
MNKIKTLDDLRRLRDNLRSDMNIRENSEHPDRVVQVKVAMATCGISSGAKETMDFFVAELRKRQINAIVTQTGCMSYCYAEPTVEIKLPGGNPVVFGNVDIKKADELIEVYIKTGRLVDGLIPVNHKEVEQDNRRI